MSSLYSYGARCAGHASSHPDKPAIIFVTKDASEIQVSWAELEAKSNQVARLLQDRGAHKGSVVIVALQTCLEHYYVSLGAWKIGACVLPLNAKLPNKERNGLLDLAASWRPTVVVGDWDVEGYTAITSDELSKLDAYDRSSLPDIISKPGRAIGSGGSTGRPKIIVDPKPFAHVPECWGPLNHIGMRPGQTTLITGRLYHSMGFELSHLTLFEGHTIVLPERFDPEQMLDLIERHCIQFIAFIPIMMQRIAKVAGFLERDLSSIEVMYHAGGACPEWLKHEWLKVIPAERQWELYGSTEAKGTTLIRADDWLKHPGSVGKPFRSEIVILNDAGEKMSLGEVGEIHMRNVAPPGTSLGATWPEEPTCEYVGAPPPKATKDGFTSVGDMGWVDEEGYLHLADRRVDMIKSGGSNIFPAEIEAALSEHQNVSDVVVIGVPDEEWGLRVHALIEVQNGKCTPDVKELDAFCRERLVYYKAPKTYEFVESMPRDESGKIRRIALREDRKSGWIEGMIAVQGNLVRT